MYYSKTLNLLFVAIPKTGTVTVQKLLKKMDPQGETSTITIEGRVFTGKDFAQGIAGHARACEIENVVGRSFFKTVNSFTFVRDPMDKLVSIYHFNKQNTFANVLNFKGERKLFLRKVKYLITLFLAKFFPFYIWVFLYPYKSNMEYVVDKNGSRIVKYIGRTSHLKEDLVSILRGIGVNTDSVVGHNNKSNHKSFDLFYTNKIFAKLIFRKFKRDIEFYNTVCKEMENG